MGTDRNLPPSRGSNLYWAKSFLKFFAIAFLVTLPLLFFQNCGQSISSSERLPARSPFASQRVYLTKPTIAQKLAMNQKLEESKENIPVTVIVDNVCAAEQCSQQNDLNDEPLTCALIKESMVPQLKNSLQAYNWQVRSDSTEASVEKFLNRNQADHDCVIGVSITRQYKTKQVTDSKNPLLAHQYQHEVLKTKEALAFFTGQGLPEVKVGIVDTGVDFRHEDLSYIPGQVDWPSSNPRCTTICNGHGTFVAGLIGAQKDNDKGGFGIAPNVSIRSYRVGNAEGQFETTELYNALNWSLQVDQVEIMNLSLGGTALADQSIHDMMVRLIQADTVVVVAAGNDGMSLDLSPTYPAAFNFDGQINVASASPTSVDASRPGPYNVTGSAIALDSFSNFSAGLVHIAAPGQSVYSTLPNNQYTKWSGTSFSTPLVVGALAVLKGYLKRKGFTNVSAPILKEILLTGSRTIPALNGKVAESKYLDLMLMKSAAESFAATMNANPVQINLIKSGAVTIGATKYVRVEIEVLGGTVGANQIVRAYTNRAFLEDSNTHLTCTIVSARQFCTFDVSYDRLYTEPEIYFVLESSAGTRLADLSIPKSSLELGSRADAALQGAIENSRAKRGYFHAEGWACLTGFDDQITIEVRKDSQSGPVVRTLKTIRQARGDFFARCQAPGIDFGFSFVAPFADLLDNQEHRYYFRAIHPGTGKWVDLAVMTYHPLSGESRQPEYTDSVLWDPRVGDQVDLQITKREMVNWHLKVEGRACYRNGGRKAPVILNIFKDDFTALFPSVQRKLGTSRTPAVVQSEASVKSVSNEWEFTNPNAMPSIFPAGTYGCGGSFSDISYPCEFSGDPRLGEDKKVNFLLPLDVQNKDLEIPEFIVNEAWLTQGKVSVMPHIEVGDGCPHPSGFVIDVDLNPWIQKVKFTAGYSYRADKVSEAQVRSILGPEVLALMGPPPAADFSALARVRRTLRPTISVAGYLSQGGRTSVPVFLSFDDFNAMKSGPGVGPANMPYSELSTVAVQKNPAEVAGDGLVEIFSTGWVATPANATRLFTSLSFDRGVSLGGIGADLKLEFAINGTGPWYDSNIDLEASARNIIHKQITGYFGSDIDLPAPTHSIQFRIRSNNRNNLMLETLHFLAQ